MVQKHLTNFSYISYYLLFMIVESCIFLCFLHSNFFSLIICSQGSWSAIFINRLSCISGIKCILSHTHNLIYYPMSRQIIQTFFGEFQMHNFYIHPSYLLTSSNIAVLSFGFFMAIFSTVPYNHYVTFISIS